MKPVSPRIYLTGIACVGKTSIGAKLAEMIGCPFFDLSVETEVFFKMSIPRLRSKCITEYSFRIEAAKALSHFLSKPESKKSVIALPPSGLMGGYWKVVKKSDGRIVALTDTPENILKRITFYDVDSRRIEKVLSPKEQRYYLRDIKTDLTYFGKSYTEHAEFSVNIAGLSIEEAAAKVAVLLSPGTCGLLREDVTLD